MVARAFPPSPGRQRHVDLYEFEASLVYTAYSKAAKATQDPISEEAKRKQKEKKKKEKRNRKRHLFPKGQTAEVQIV